VQSTKFKEVFGEHHSRVLSYAAFKTCQFVALMGKKEEFNDQYDHA